jgi:DNA modification methylase
MIDLRLGDCLEVLKTYADSSVDSCVTDAPYGLSFMGKKWDYDVPSVDIWREVFRVLKPGGHLLAFGGTRTYHRLVVAIEDAGFEVRDQVQWIYGQGFPKSLNVEKAGGGPQTAGLGTALKPANEPICLARKPLEKGLTVAQNVQKWGTGAINVDGCRVLSDDKRPGSSLTCEKCLGVLLANSAEKKIGPVAGEHLTDSVALSVEDCQSAGASTTPLNTSINTATLGLNTGTTRKINTSTSSSIDLSGGNPFRPDMLSTISITTRPTIGSKICKSCGGPTTFPTTNLSTKTINNEKQNMPAASASLGRFPSNVILDEVAGELLDQMAAGYGRSNGNKTNDKSGHQNEYVGGELINKISGPCYSDKGGVSRFFYCAKASTSERNAGLEGMPEKSTYVRDGANNPSPNRQIRADNAVKNVHPTVKPIKLMEYLCRLITPPGGTILDPFMGSGTTGIAAKRLGFDFIGIEMNPEYFAIAEKRILNAQVEAPEENPQVEMAEA